MNLRNIHGFSNVDEYIRYKLSAYSNEDKNFETLFQFMFDEKDNVMIETTDGYRIKKITYGEVQKSVLKTVPTLEKLFSELPTGEIIGLYMSNCPEWITLFWAILAAGYCPLLMNTRLPDEILNSLLEEYGVKGVISDSHTFNVKTIFKEDALEVSDMKSSNRPFGREVFFMSSGTSMNVKLCVYTGENFYYQVCDTLNIVTECPDIKQNYQGEIKQLVLLPLYHIFGFVAVYLWFGFFARTFVFPHDLNPDTIRRTIKKNKVTHIFCVPMIWESISKTVIEKVKSRGDKTYHRFLKVTSLVNSSGVFGDFLARRLLHEVREELFGDSIRFMISGGSEISKSTLELFNGIGYHLANGYGMTEIGITSVEKSGSRKFLNSGSIGSPFGNTEYNLDENGCLCVRGKSRASRIICDGKETILAEDEWFTTGDVMHTENGRYYADGRSDDLIICENGENLNPQLIEASLHIEGVDRLCVFLDNDKKVSLIASVVGYYNNEKLIALHDSISKALIDSKIDRVIQHIYITRDSLVEKGQFKLSRKKLSERIKEGQIKFLNPSDSEKYSEEVLEDIEIEVRECFAKVLGKNPSTVGKDSNFFRDLGGTSIDYFALLSMIKSKFSVEILEADYANLSTVKEFSDFLRNNL